MQHKLTEGALLDAEGKLAEAGYATFPVKKYDRAAIKAGKSRIKEWDYYLIHNDRYGIALTVADNGYMGMVSATLLNFCDKCETTGTKIILFPMGKVGLQPDSSKGTFKFTGSGCEIEYVNDQDGGKARKLTLKMKNFHDKQPLSVEMILFGAPKDSMVIATPFKKDGAAGEMFYYNRKIINMSVNGTATIGETKYYFGQDSRALLDWGRGVWPKESTWYWSAAQGNFEDKKFGFNLGYGFGDTSAATENMLFLDGVAHKLEDVTFNIPKTAEGAEDYMKPWKFTSGDGRFTADFTPILNRHSNANALVAASNQNQVFGFFDGTAKLDDGTEVPFKHLLGFAEKVVNKW